ncbi:MAG: flap endonuclease-1 [Methanobacterium sp.]|uniref:flap endonuclease-1 n=1 Tax=Methanobacterium sp. TaxID=2164 RepID=UPI003D64BE40|nr:flap endonuclease-1 [Methanobacterium sp.]
MGLKFRDIVSAHEIKLKDLKGKTVALDAANIIYQFLASIRQMDGTPLMDHDGNITSHFSGILYRTSSLVDNGIKPVYVFDGKAHELKKDTQDERRQIRTDAEKKWKNALEEGRIDDARKFAVRSSRMSTGIIEGSKALLELMGIPYIQAKSEGEAQASYMVSKGDAWCVASQDYDCTLFGAPRMVKNLASRNAKYKLEMIHLNEVLEENGLTREQLIDVAILVGTDFNEGIKGIGAKKGRNLIKKHGDVYKALKHLKIEMDVDPQEIRDIFLDHDFVDDYKIKWVKADREGVIDFLCEKHDFSVDRVDGALEKLKKLNLEQKSLEQWFNPLKKDLPKK